MRDLITFEQIPYLVAGQAIWRYDPLIGSVTKHTVSEISTVTSNNEIQGYIVILDDQIENSIMIMGPMRGESIGHDYCYLFEHEIPLGTSTIDQFVTDLFERPMKRG